MLSNRNVSNPHRYMLDIFGLKNDKFIFLYL